ncbi:MAG: YdbH domain-containing protein [Myxococcales bacterium]|nr:YdbH domain-containing protein [Myxococcales bacterium]
MKRWQKVLLIAAGAVVVLLVVLSFVIDGIATSKAREQADKLSQEWGRKVEIGGVTTRFLTGLGVRVSDVKIGPGEGEPLPLLDLKRVEVKMALIKAALSGGKDVEIRSAEIQGLTVNIVRMPDGTTNLERLQDKLAQQPKKPQQPAEKESDLSFLRVDHAALHDGKIALVDKDRQLAVQHLDVEVNDLRAGKPLEVLLKAAVLTEKQNLELHVKAAPLPKSLTPTPTALVLRIDPPIDLAPLGPFAGKEIGLQSGTFDADFDAELGAAVPGGTGPTNVKGAIKAASLQFAKGKKFDVAVDTNLTGDMAKGDVQIDRLQIDFGPAGITGHGRAQGVTSGQPKIENLEIVSHDLDPSKLDDYYPPLRKQLAPNTIAGPIGLHVSGSGTEKAPVLEAKIDLTPVKLVVPGQMAKAAGAPLTVTAHLKGADKFDVKVDLAGVDLRPGQSIDKAPGQRLDVAVQGSRKGERIDVADLKAHVLEDELEGRGFLDGKKFDFQLTSSGLNLDKLLLPSTKKKESKPLDPKTFAGVDGHAKVQIDKLTYRKQTVTDIVADVLVHEDDVKVNTAQLKAFGGTVSASGTEIKLAHPNEPFHLVTKLDNVGLDNLLALASDHKLLSGKFNGNIDLKGGGQGMKDLAQTLAGVLDGHVLDGNFYGKDLVASVSGPLAKSLPFGLAGKEGQGGTTSLGKDLPFGVTLENGLAKLKQPVKISRPEAEMTFSGGIHVDGMLDMPGTISLAPQTIAAITGGKVKPSAPIPVNLKLIGPAWSPTLSDLDLKPAVNQIVKEAGSALVGKALGVDPAQAQAEAQKKADAVQQDAQKKAAEEAARQKQKLEEEAKNRLKGLFGK